MQTQDPKTAGQHQTMLIVWVALLISQVMFVVMAYVVKPELLDLEGATLAGNDPIITAVFGALALAAVAASVYFRKQTVTRGIAEHKVEMIQSGMITGVALAEAASLLGLMLAFAFDYKYFFLWIGLGILGTLLHFPRRADIEAANFRRL
jgi:hypothetical protein